MQNLKFHLSFLALCFIQGISCQSIVLSPTKAYVDINESLTLTCAYIGYINVEWTKWIVNNQATPTTVRHQDNTCSGSGILADGNIYIVGCPSDTSFTVTILRVQQEDINTQWQCFDRDRKSNIVKIFEEDPPQKPVIIGFTDGEKYSLIESEFGNLSCSSHGGNPLANFMTWNCYN
ncbi:synaptogenesis protein syg-2-like, partial [Ruditapes philippinarum]|uniref:synaptogenesis protein syg-2-like n=1 Tax=Ruditapes philippinarum TaxID=129788 RepID=UPI00295A5E2E